MSRLISLLSIAASVVLTPALNIDGTLDLVFHFGFECVNMSELQKPYQRIQLIRMDLSIKNTPVKLFCLVL